MFITSNNIRESCNFDFHSELMEVARAAAINGSCSFYWLDFLTRLLQHWNATIDMDLRNATDVMIESVGYQCADGMNVLPLSYNDFWYRWWSDVSSFPFLVSTISFKITIAVFETINDLCASEYPNAIIFNKANLQDKLRNHAVSIDWNSYKVL